MGTRIAIAALAGLAAVGAAGVARAQVAAGTLTCEVAGGVGYVIGSRREVTCTYQNARGGLEIYDGTLSKLGVDLGISGGSRIVWAVLAPTNGRPGALAGTYVGATASVSVGAGVGANALVGGSRRSVTLQPVSLSSSEGFNLAAGAADLSLRVRPEPRLR